MPTLLPAPTLPSMDGYMIDVQADAELIRVHGKTKAARIALAGQDHETDVVIPRADIETVTFKGANPVVNGNLIITTIAGRKFQLHFRRKQQADFRPKLRPI
jgi:hypothetical protein